MGKLSMVQWKTSDPKPLEQDKLVLRVFFFKRYKVRWIEKEWMGRVGGGGVNVIKKSQRTSKNPEYVNHASERLVFLEV